MVKNAIAIHRKPISELWSVTRRMGSESVTCHSTQVNAPRLNPSHIGRYSIYLPGGMEGWVDLGGWLHTEIVYLPLGSHPFKAWRRVTSLIGWNALPLCQATNPNFNGILVYTIRFNWDMQSCSQRMNMNFMYAHAANRFTSAKHVQSGVLRCSASAACYARRGSVGLHICKIHCFWHFYTIRFRISCRIFL